MTTPHALRTLASLIESVNGADVTVDSVETPGTPLVEDRTLTADLGLRFELDSFEDVDGALSVTLPDGTAVAADGSAVEIPLAVEIDAGDGRAADRSPVDATRQVTDGGVAMHATSSDGGTAADGCEEGSVATAETDGARSDGATEPHRDPERLREVYETCETFAEMTEALDTTVTPQTVRRNMIEHGIHEPRTRTDSETGDGESTDDESESDAASAPSEPRRPAEAGHGDTRDGGTASAESSDEEEPEDDVASDASRSDESDDDSGLVEDVDLPEAVDLPSHVALDDLRRAVVDATTLYEVQSELRIDRSTARRVLRDLDLLDLVTGRVTTTDEQTSPAAVVDERIRRACS